MEDAQLATILTAISDSRNEATKATGALAVTVAGYHADLNARMIAVESAQKSDKMWSRINRSLVPIYAIGHGILAHFGIRV